METGRSIAIAEDEGTTKMTYGGSGDIKIKLYEAVRDLVGPGTINERLRRATQGICVLLEDDLPVLVSDRFMALRHKLTVDHGFLRDDAVPVTDTEGDELANELLAIFAIVCDPPHIGKALRRPAE
jgi:hypothetical protein